MNKKLLFSCFISVLIISLQAFSQKDKKAGGLRDAFMVSARVFDADVLDTLKSTTTVFFYGNETGLTLDSLKTAVSAAWDITPIIFENSDRIGKYIGERGYSYFTIESTIGVIPIEKNLRGFEHASTATHIYLTLRSFTGPGLYRIELYPDPKTLLSDDYNHFEYGIAYKKGHFYNWTPVYLRAHIQAAASDLKKSFRPELEAKFSSDSLQELLRNDTLYISANMLGKYNPLAGKNKGNKNNVFKELKTPYRICSDSELYSIFITENRGRLLFEYVKSSRLKFIKIFDLKYKQVIYKDFDQGYNLSENDLRNIYK